MALLRSKVFALQTCLTLSALAGCATESDDTEAVCDQTAAESSTQQLSVSEPLRGIYHWDAPNGPLLVDEAAKWLGREQDLGLAFTARDKWSDVTGPSWQLGPWSQWVKAKPGRNLVGPRRRRQASLYGDLPSRSTDPGRVHRREVLR